MMVAGGLERASSGRVEVAGRDLGPLDDDARARLRRDSIGIVFQGFHLIPTMTAHEDVALPLKALAKQVASGEKRRRRRLERAWKEFRATGRFWRA